MTDITRSYADWDLPTDLPTSFMDAIKPDATTQRKRVLHVTKEAHRALKIRAAQLDVSVFDLGSRAVAEWCEASEEE